MGGQDYGASATVECTEAGNPRPRLNRTTGLCGGARLNPTHPGRSAKDFGWLHRRRPQPLPAGARTSRMKRRGAAPAPPAPTVGVRANLERRITERRANGERSGNGARGGGVTRTRSGSDGSQTEPDEPRARVVAPQGPRRISSLTPSSHAWPSFARCHPELPEFP